MLIESNAAASGVVSSLRPFCRPGRESIEKRRSCAVQAGSNGTTASRSQPSQNASKRLVGVTKQGRPYPLGATISEEQVHFALAIKSLCHALVMYQFVLELPGICSLALVVSERRGNRCLDFLACHISSFLQDATNFALFSRNATGVDLCFFVESDLQAGRVSEALSLDSHRNKTGDIWHIEVPVLEPELLYGQSRHLSICDQPCLAKLISVLCRCFQFESAPRDIECMLFPQHPSLLKTVVVCDPCCTVGFRVSGPSEGEEQDGNGHNFDSVSSKSSCIRFRQCTSSGYDLWEVSWV